MESELREAKTTLESEREAFESRLVRSTSDQAEDALAEMSAQLERESEIARVQSELAETKSSLESERDALQAAC